MSATDGTNGFDAATLAAYLARVGLPLRSGEQPDYDREAALLIDASMKSPFTPPLTALARLRSEGLLLGFLVGSERFLGRDYDVETGVAVPHPATELLALLTARVAEQRVRTGIAPRVVEVGIGVGVVSVSVLETVSEAQAHASELVGACLRLSETNARRAGVDDRLHLYQAYTSDDPFQPFLDAGEGTFDIVVANPPYLVEGDQVSEATKRSGVAHFSFSPDDDPNWFLHGVVGAAKGILADSCSVLMECADWYLFEHENLMLEAGWQVESFEREEYEQLFGAPAEMATMNPTAHRVMHAWQGDASSLLPSSS